MKTNLRGKAKKAFMKELFIWKAWKKQSKVRSKKYYQNIEEYEKKVAALGYDAARAAGYLVKQGAETK